MTTEPLRVGIIGAGANMRLKHIPGLRAQNGVELVGLANRREDSSKKAAKELNIPKVYANWTEIVADPSIDAVCIGTWPYMHAQMTIAALEAGKHVLCEARMAMNAREAHAMLAASRRNPQLVAQIVPAPYALPVDRTIADTIASDAIGNLIAVDLRVSSSGNPIADTPLHWLHSRDLCGNNIMALGGWYEQIMRWVGPAASAFAVGQVVVRHRKDAAGNRVPMTIPDHIDVTGYLQQGGQYRLIVSSTIGHTTSRSEAWFHGEKGTLAYCIPHEGEPYLQVAKMGGAIGPLAIDPAKRGAWRVEEEFVNAVRGCEQVTHTDFLTGVKYMEWTDAVNLSLCERREVQLPLHL
ncbi:Gfo/Idh/MocA family oxidoreductase [Bradyrhizobium diazoefficiens]|uniref:Gfo/Idh/MocA family protein n=1 Tax=Bradyrhizobium diazoefficiens TaxID=1355477 RepID=UPI00190C577B|nr:Gfo/Idh/MocA family oxidoreductase [Bradyrhizobium diazoefficiens]QQO35534.1 Gfo/Idh/MocA family oxidoreductase [Bradyrhizobium diazoefficiens]